MRLMPLATIFVLSCWVFLNTARAQHASPSNPSFQLPVRWQYGPPLIAPENRITDASRAQKDPTVVQYEGRWHVFMTVKLEGRSAIEHCSFENWSEANASTRSILDISDSDYYCAPQVFFFQPDGLWYLVYQVGVRRPPDSQPGRPNMMWVAYSTTKSIDRPNSWTKAKPMLDGGPDDPREVGGLDYWIICDDERAFLFYTSLNSKLWRLSTGLDAFPNGFDDCTLALEGPFFEASHTYKVNGTDQYLTIIEENGRRYYKAYIADRLDGTWTPIAATAEHPFASHRNIQPTPGTPVWTDNVSHGELVRAGYDQKLEIEPENIKFVFQGMLEKDKQGIGYGGFQWRIGMLTAIE